ncbi:HNH endonuclease domain-containing protein [Mycoplasmopsis felis]
MIPKSRCGGDNQDNLVICHAETNEEKADRTYELVMMLMVI